MRLTMTPSELKTFSLRSVLLLEIFCSSCVFSKTGSAFFEEACSNGTPSEAVWWNHKPYVFTDEDTGAGSAVKGVLVDVLNMAVKSCCKEGTQIVYTKAQPTGAVKESVIKGNAQRIVLPVGRRAGKTNSIYGRSFAGFVESPHLSVVISNQLSGSDLMSAVLDAWPILIFILMSLLVSGVLVWFLEYHTAEPKEFVSNFPFGVFDGFWWASVTMTTVGYGDKVPKSIIGRLFGVIWINVGLVILAMFMGIITTSLTANSLGHVTTLYGMSVAVLNGSSEHHVAVLHNANTRTSQTYDDVYKSVASGDTKIALVDAYTTTQHEALFSRHSVNAGSTMAKSVIYGVVLPNTTNSKARKKCFTDYINDHQLELYETLAKYIHPAKASGQNEDEGSEYFTGGSIFGYSVYAMTALLFVLLIAGLVWQFRFQPRSRDPDSQSEGIQDEKLKVQQNGQNSRIMEKEQKEQPSNQNFRHSQAVNQVMEDREMNGFKEIKASVATAGKKRTERLMAQQSCEILKMEEEYKAFRQMWEKNFRSMQERHKVEQVQMFQLAVDNQGYQM